MLHVPLFFNSVEYFEHLYVFGLKLVMKFIICLVELPHMTPRSIGLPEINTIGWACKPWWIFYFCLLPVIHKVHWICILHSNCYERSPNSRHNRDFLLHHFDALARSTRSVTGAATPMFTAISWCTLACRSVTRAEPSSVSSQLLLPVIYRSTLRVSFPSLSHRQLHDPRPIRSSSPFKHSPIQNPKLLDD